MKKIFTLLILLMLLPVTALAVETNTVYVGGVALAGSSTSIVYATTNESGEVITEGATADNYNIKWDGSTLTLHDATIQKELYASDLPLSNIAGAAIGVINQSGDAGLTVQLEGNNKIEGVSTGIHVRSSGGNAALNITGNGTLVVNSNYLTIQVTSIGGNAALSIENAKVTATSSYSNVVTVQSGNSENSSASLTVDGGSLTATAPSNNVSGIRFVFGSGGSGSGTPNLTVSGNATVRANGSAGGITNNSSTGVQYGTGSDSTGGIVFDGKNGTVYGNVTLQEDLEIGEGESLTIGDGASLTVPEGTTLTNNGTINVESGGKLTGDAGGEVVYAPAVTTQPTSQTVTKGETATFTVVASGTDPLSYQWQQSTNGFDWADIEGATSATYTIEATTTSMNDYQYRCVVSNSAGSVESNAATLTVNEHTHVLVKVEAKAATCTEPGNIEYWYCEGCSKYFKDENATEEITLEEAIIKATGHTEELVGVKEATCTEDGYTGDKICTVCNAVLEKGTVIPATGHHYVNGTCTVCGEKDPDYRPDPISYYNIYVEDVCDGVEVTTSKNVVREGGSVSVYVEKDTANYTFDNFKVYYKRSYYGGWEELKEGTQPDEYPIKNIWTHIYIKAEGAEEKEDPTGIESIEGVKVYTKDGSLYVQTPQREQVIIVSMSGVVVKNEEQIGLKQYHGLQPGIYIVRVGNKAYKLRLN